MGKFFDQLTQHHQDFIAKQHMFFVSSAPLSADGHVNLSPKGLDSFRVLSPTRVAYMDLTSSGNETSAHLLENGRITIMFCSFEGAPNILRLYGKGYTVLPSHSEWTSLVEHFTVYPSTRQFIVAEIYKVQTSCGFGIPLYEYTGERTHHFDWAGKFSEDDLSEYRQQKNMVSLDGLPTALGMKKE